MIINTECDKCPKASKHCPKCGSACVLGSEYFEHIDIDIEPFCGEGTCKNNSSVEGENNISMSSVLGIHIEYCVKCDKIVHYWLDKE